MNNNAQNKKNSKSLLKIILPIDIKEKLTERAIKNCRKPANEALFILVECLTKQEKEKENLETFLNEFIERKRKVRKQR